MNLKLSTPDRERTGYYITEEGVLSIDSALIDEGLSISMLKRHEQWMSIYGRVYKDNAEKQRRQNIFNGHEDVCANSESDLLKAVANQSISVAINASGSAFQFYSSGVFTGDCGTELDHGVTAVGYGTDADSTPYWLVKNTWGTTWGEEGYIIMQCEIDAKQGLCGIAMQPSYPTA